MIPCDENFVWVRLEVKPGERVVKFVVGARLGQIARVNENVALRERRLSVVGVVCVGYANNADGWCAGSGRGRGVGTVEPTCKVKERRRREEIPSSSGAISTMDDGIKASHVARVTRIEEKVTRDGLRVAVSTDSTGRKRR